MFGSNKQEDPAKDDLLAKLVADEQQERRLAAAAANQPSSVQRPAMSMFESSTRSTTTTSKYCFYIKLLFIYMNLKIFLAKPTTTTDPFESLFSNDSNKPTASRTNAIDDIFSTKPSNPSTTQTKNDPFESLFGSSSTTNNTKQNDKLQRPKLVQNATTSIPNRTTVDEVEEFVL
jgi:hypothetical protein